MRTEYITFDFYHSVTSVACGTIILIDGADGVDGKEFSISLIITAETPLVRRL
jgi:hypothetical protein